MTRILLADDSPHAQRMGERILRDEGYEVVSVTDGETALLRLGDVDPDVVIADVFLPGRSGLDICRHIRSTPAHQHVRIVLAAGMLEVFDEQEAREAGAHSIVRKPFEASVVLEMIKPLVAAAEEARGKPETAAEVPPVPAAPPEPPVAAAETAAGAPEPIAAPPEPVAAEPAAVPDPKVVTIPRPAESAAAPLPEPPRVPSGTGVSEEELLRSAVTIALDAAFPSLVENITAQVLRNLRAGGDGSGDRDQDLPVIPFPVPPFPGDNT